VSIQRNIVTCPTCREKFIRDNVFAPFFNFLLSLSHCQRNEKKCASCQYLLLRLKLSVFVLISCHHFSSSFDVVMSTAIAVFISFFIFCCVLLPVFVLVDENNTRCSRLASGCHLQQWLLAYGDIAERIDVWRQRRVCRTQTEKLLSRTVIRRHQISTYRRATSRPYTTIKHFPTNSKKTVT